MLNRRVLFGPIEFAYLTGFSKGFEIAGTHLHLPKSDLREIAFATLFQSGADTIETVADISKDLPNLGILSDRIDASSHPEWSQCFILTHSVFKPIVNNFQSETKMAKDLSTLQSFLTELFYAMHRGHPMAIAQPIPNLDHLKGALPAKLYISLKNLFATFHSIQPIVVTPETSVAVRDIALFLEILSTQLFNDYQTSHEYLSDETIDAQLSIEDIKKATIKLCDKAHRLIKPHRISAFLFPLISKTIGAFFGTLPAALADQLRILIEPAIDPKKRLIIYQLDSILCDTFEAYLSSGKFKHR